MDVVLETSGLTKRYGRTDALRRCDLSLAAGKVTGLVGPNGAGKTTLLNIAVGLHRPTAGRIRVLGLDPWREGVALLSRVGFVAQDRPLHPGFTVAETLEIGRRLNPRWDHAYALARQALRPPARPSGAVAFDRAARSGGAHACARQAAGGAASRRAGREPRS